ncbi:MAG: hypothetical protein V4617_22110 [Gemmatimonadota bacterium]
MLALSTLTSLLLSALVLEPAAVTSAPAAAAVVTATAGGIGFPKIPMPRFRIPGRSKKDKADAPMALVDRRLRLLVSQEESFFVGHSRYGADVAKVAKSRPATVSAADRALENVQVQVIYAHSKGWTAVATHPSAPGKSCVVYVGFRETLPIIPRTRADAAEAVDEGRPVCDK